MPDIRISELNPATTLVATDELPIVQSVGSAPVTKQITAQQLADGLASLPNTGLANKSYVNTAINNLIGGAPGVLDTLKELADAIADDPQYFKHVNDALDLKLNKSSFTDYATNWFATVTTANLIESQNTNLYFTTARAQAAAKTAISVGTPNAANGGGALSYNNGVFTFTPAVVYVLPTASHTVLGGVKVDGTTITISNGVISGANTYVLPTASIGSLGGVKVDGTTIAINNGVISSIGGGSSTWANITDISNSNGPTHIAIGQNAGETGGGYGSAGANSVAIGVNSGSQNQGVSSVAVGSNAGKLSQQGASIAIGNAAGFDSQGSQSLATGWMAGYDHQGSNAIAVGTGAGKITQGNATVAIGWNAGETNQGANAIAIGEEAGSTDQHANSIVINASGNPLDSTSAGLYINPIRSASSTNNVVYYNTTTKEVTYGDPIFSTVTTTNLNVQNLTFTGTGPVTFTSGNDLNFTSSGDIKFNSEKMFSLTSLKAVVAASTDFADFKTRIAAL
jgi:hypothetical protein